MAHFTGEVEFWILLGNEPAIVSAKLNDSLVTLFTRLRKNDETAEHIPAKLSYSGCKFYRLKSPVSLGEDNTDDEDDGNLTSVPDVVKQAILEETNRVAVNPWRTKVRRLAETFSSDHVYLVIEIPDREYHQFLGCGCFVMLIRLLS